MSLIPYSELKRGIKIIFNNQPHEIIEASSMFKGRGHSVLQAKLKNLINGNIISQTFHPSDNFEEAELSKIKAKFIYTHRDRYYFYKGNDSSKRFDLAKEQIGLGSQFLKPEQIVEALEFKNKVINTSLPIKIQLKVAEAPPGLKGDRAQVGTKVVTLETGVKINVPLFIKKGDVIELNSETGEYVKRVE